MPQRIFTAFNLLGGVLWSVIVICLGFGLAHIPGVTGFVSSYIDLVLVGIVVLSVGPIIVRAIVIRRRLARAQR